VLTALVCTKGRLELLRACLASLEADLPEGGELLVVVHGDAAAAEEVRALGVPARVLHEDRRGKSRQLNVGIAAARHDVVVLTDDDCRVQTGWLAAMAAPFVDPSMGATFGFVRGLSGVRGADLQPEAPGPAPEVTWRYANGAAMAVRRGAIHAIGGFDERLGPGAPLHGEEHDVVLRLQEAGWAVAVADAPPVGHVEWRSDEETRQNLLVYSHGAGAFVGAALRRAPRRWARLWLRRTRYQLGLWRHGRVEGAWFGPATTWAYVTGVVRGLRLRPERYLPLEPSTEPARPPGAD
jgi:GT2 family glycosyltransferase